MEYFVWKRNVSRALQHFLLAFLLLWIFFVLEINEDNFLKHIYSY